jgi:hypothetical protein
MQVYLLVLLRCWLPIFWYMCGVDMGFPAIREVLHWHYPLFTSSECRIGFCITSVMLLGFHNFCHNSLFCFWLFVILCERSFYFVCLNNTKWRVTYQKNKKFFLKKKDSKIESFILIFRMANHPHMGRDSSVASVLHIRIQPDDWHYRLLSFLVLM